MKKLFVLLVAISAISTAFVKQDSSNSQSESSLLNGSGIKFRGMTLDEAKKEAKASGKIIFIDAYTDWCGPCKKMAATAFVDEKVADLFNSKFINLKIEMEKSEDGPTVARMYKVNAYPTLLFIDGSGSLKKSQVGFQTPEQLLALGKSI